MATPSSSPDSKKRHVSELGEPRQRFLARVVDHTLSEGFRTPEEFLRDFPPAAIIESLAKADDLRVRLLVKSTGTHEKIALKKSLRSATEDLEIALAEETTTPTELVSLYPPDERVRHLDARKLWSFIVDSSFYAVNRSDEPARHARAATRLSFIVDCALSEGILSLREVADGVTFEEMAAALPVDNLRQIVKHALEIARAGAPLTEERFLNVVPLSTLVSHLPLDQVWDRVIVRGVAIPAGYVEAPPPPSVPDMPASVVSLRGEGIADAGVEPEVEENSGAVAIPEGEPAAVVDEDDVRRRVIERMRVIDRLPPGNAELSTPVLLSIESMYAELWALNDDDEREACIRESFPNDTLLRTAMLSLIELLDPSVDTHDPIIREADVSGLIKIVLFEERRRRDAGVQSRRPTPFPGSNSRGRRSVPPPLPRQSTPPPLPTAANPPPLPAENSKRDR